MSGSARSLAVDLLKLGLALMVVGIHANPVGWAGPVARLLSGEGIFRLAVPVFLIFNGYFLQGAIASGRGWPYVRRAAQLYALWMLIYIPVAWPLWSGDSPLSQKLLTAVFGYWHLWYLSGMAMAAALVVALARWRDAPLMALALCSLLGGIAVFYLMSLGWIKPDPEIFLDPLLPHRNPLTICLPYLLIGLLMRRMDLAARLPRAPVIGLALAGLGLVCVESLLLGFLAPVGVSHDTLLSLALAAPAMALAALQWPGPSTDRRLGDQASGIYFLHVAFCAWCYRYTDLPGPAIFAIALAAALLGTWGIRRAGLAPRLL